MRRKRLQDGTLGELEKVFKGETDEEKIDRLEREKELMAAQLTSIQEYIITKEMEDLLK